MKPQTYNFSGLRFVPAIGLGYWIDIYTKDSVAIDGVSYTILLPFVKIYWGYLILD